MNVAASMEIQRIFLEKIALTIFRENDVKAEKLSSRLHETSEPQLSLERQDLL